MKPVVTAEEYRRVDKAFTGDLIAAMDRAGHAVAHAAARRGAGYGSRVAVLVGPGNNGGDGYVAARYLKDRGAFVTVHALTDPKTREARDAASRSSSAGVRVASLSEVVEADVVIDALFGGGARRGLPSEVLAWMDTMAPVVAVDYPTGLDADTGGVDERAFEAVETVTFGSLKTSHVRGDGLEHCGHVTVVDIGIQGGKPSLFIAEEEDAPRPARERNAHKWSAGAVLVLGGSPGLVGASIHAARSALGFGAGTVYITSSRVDEIQRIAPEIPAIALDDAVNRLDRFDVVVAGPGLAPGDAGLAQPVLARARQVVLDAGGLTAEALAAAKKGGGDVVVTPHDGEFSGIAGVGPGTYAVRSLAAREGIVVLRKGNPTMVSDGGLPVLVTSGGPELATVGTGDVLAGMIGALWARGLEPGEAAISAAYWHGVAGRELARHQTVTADVLSDYISALAW